MPDVVDDDVGIGPAIGADGVDDNRGPREVAVFVQHILR